MDIKNPLQWPDDVARNVQRQSTRCKKSWLQAVNELMTELRKAKLRHATLTTNVVADPNYNVLKLFQNDPGVALYYKVRGKNKILLCDRYSNARDNVLAIVKMIEHTRKIRETGVKVREVVKMENSLNLFNH